MAVLPEEVLPMTKPRLQKCFSHPKIPVASMECRDTAAVQVRLDMPSFCASVDTATGEYAGRECVYTSTAVNLGYVGPGRSHSFTLCNSMRSCSWQAG
jgi:hypothetical protein